MFTNVSSAIRRNEHGTTCTTHYSERSELESRTRPVRVAIITSDIAAAAAAVWLARHSGVQRPKRVSHICIVSSRVESWDCVISRRAVSVGYSISIVCSI